MCEADADITVVGHTDDMTVRPDIVLEMLHDLRTGQYRPSAWVRFAVQSWRMSQQTAQARPWLVRSWRRAVLGLTLAEAAIFMAEARTGGDEDLRVARRAAPGAAICLVYTLTDAYVHLGMNNEARGAPLLDTVGLPTVLTLTRCMVTGILFGHLLGGVPARRSLTQLALAAASITDVADGYLARKLHRTTRLGAYLDSEADFGAGIAVSLTLLARRSLPAWLVAGMLARWAAPFAYTLACYFGQGSRVRIGSTFPGKVAGVAQTVTLGMALLPDHVVRRVSGLRRALQVVTAVLLIAAPISQFARTRGGSSLG